MTLRSKTLLAGGITLAVLVAVLHVVTVRLLLTRFAVLETRETAGHMQRATHVLDSILLRLDYALVGWSQWDESYRFIRTNDPKLRREFVTESLSDQALAQCRADVIIYVRNNGQIIFGKGYDRRASKTVPLPEGLVSHLSAGSLLLHHRDAGDSLQGIVLLPRGPLLLVSRPVVSNAGKGPLYGSLIWGRFLRSAEIKELSQLLHLPLSVQRFDAPRLPSDFQMARSELTKNSSKPYVNALNEDTIGGYVTIKDIYGKPALLVRGDVQRDIYKEGQISVRYLLLAVLGVGLIFGLLALGSLEQWVLAPLSRLSRNVEQISASGDVSVRVPADGHVEFSQLAHSVNSLLAAVEQAEHGLRAEIVVRERAEQTAHQARDEAEQTRAEAERACNEAEDANLAKSDFLSRMSHELRTPLNAILGFGQIMEMQELTPLQNESIKHILKGGRHLLALINEVLDLARVEAGHLELSLEPVGVREIVDEVASLIRPLADQNDIRLDASFRAVSDVYVLADQQRLKQVLINLLSNAVKYNHRGGSVSLSCAESTVGRIRIGVTDTGPGIAAQDLGKLFVPFERLGAEKSLIEGTGLGLAFSKRLVEAMGGTIDVESVTGQGTLQGSTFTVELPRAEVPLAPKSSPGGVASPGAIRAPATIKTVLSIEDNASNYRLIETILSSRPGIKLLGAMQGRVGLDIAFQHRPDLILLDLHLPDIMGHEVLRQLQEVAETKDIPVVILSADATPPQIERLLAAGARAYLTKPLNVKQFLEVLGEMLKDENPIRKVSDEGDA
jgi:signal transduction histidine kinase/CheY-like chemotaxis protein